ncbi:MBOAT family O-acyltransferase [Bacteroides mediterraneensis]|uniref:MBOAT family protein n=1 Tax=Bacteroides mediterraneensis TaxID=1841856 RepID=A0ABS2EWI7_9BACE|nr:MBOAT family O-acyltransferase [Bacteroides mediterraneensis]MBM6759057.1 MBOAT family protein [Bacteroides mediterraneensis]
MLFNTFNFWIIFPFIFTLYWIIPSQLNLIKKIFLIVISYLLYINYNAPYAFVLLYITLITYGSAKIIEQTNYKRQLLIIIAAILTLGPLLIFKYYNFISENCNSILSSFGLKFNLSGLNWAIPLGISFFTFQAIGYLWDVYYKRIKPEESFIDYMLFISFFPQIASGPISKASELLPQIKQIKKFNYNQAVKGLQLLLWGMFLKVVIADRLGLYVDTVYNNYMHQSGITCLVASLFYSIQIYGDFAGYSLMAIGIAKTLGFNLINNFQRPYFSISVTDFWRRWHISLSRWLKDYIYIPMGGSRCSRLRNYWNILITFLISGIWHGANWNFIIWGILHGIFQILEKAIGLQKYTGNSKFIKVIRIGVTFILVNFAWIFFKTPSLNDACNIIIKIFTEFNGSIYQTSKTNVLLYLIGILVLLFKDIKDEFYDKQFTFWNRKEIKWIIYLILFAMIIGIGVLDSGQFIYANF